MLRRIKLVLLTCALGACVPRPAPPPPSPEPVGQLPAPPRPAPLPPPPPVAWEDAAITTGDWILREQGGASAALFGLPSEGARFFARCENGQVLIGRTGVASDRLTVRTSYGARTIAASATADGAAARLPATDPLLDQIAFSRGRFAVETPGTTLLIMPSWPEIARVTEDCRS